MASHEPGHDAPVGVDPSVPSSPRVWNYWLGGKDNYAVDRQVGDAVKQAMPQLPAIAVASRQFLNRAVTLLTRDLGIRQFLDIGTGLPTANNTHEIAQGVAPESRIVYVDNDPVVLAHARALLLSTSEGATRYIDEDLYQPQQVIEKAKATDILDFDRPIALVLLGVLGHVEEPATAKRIVDALVDALPSGSYLVTCDSTNVIDPDAMNSAAAIYNEESRPKIYLRTPGDIEAQFEKLELLEPGVVSVPLWRPDEPDIGNAIQIDEFGGVGRKP